MMEVSRLELKCPQCGVALFRATEPPADEVFCFECGASADYKEVVEKGAGLVGGRLPKEKLLALKRQLGFLSE